MSIEESRDLVSKTQTTLKAFKDLSVRELAFLELFTSVFSS